MFIVAITIVVTVITIVVLEIVAYFEKSFVLPTNPFPSPGISSNGYCCDPPVLPYVQKCRMTDSSLEQVDKWTTYYRFEYRCVKNDPRL